MGRAASILAAPLLLALALVVLGAAPPPYHAERYAVATPDPLASRAGAEVLGAGGNAADAAVAAALVLGVVQPWYSGIGGGGFALVYRAEDRSSVVLDFRETAPAAATADMFVRAGLARDASQRGGLSVAVPGEVAGLVELSRRFGRLPLARAAAPAIRLAAGGFPARSDAIALVLRTLPAATSASGRRGLFEPGGPFIGRGSIQRRPELAATLRAIAARGPDAFYRGPVARAIAAAVREAGGVMTEEDLAAYRVRERVPLSGQYHGHRLLAVPPPSSSGVVILETLGLLEPFDLQRTTAVSSSRHLHLVAEAMKAAFADRAVHLGDPDHAPVRVEPLLAPERLRERARRISPDRALPADAWASGDAPARGGGTAQISVVDQEGNAVSLTTSVNLLFGSQVIAGSTGVVLNDHMDDFTTVAGEGNAFSLVQSSLNAVGPAKRPLSSMSPVMAVGPDGVEVVLGACGGPRIIAATVQVLLGLFDFGLDASAAVSLPRVHHQWRPDRLELEEEVPADVCGALRRRGHDVRRTRQVGRAQIVVVVRRDGRRWLEAASDPRTTGVPAGDEPSRAE